MEVLACGVNLHLALKHHQRWHRKEKTVPGHHRLLENGDSHDSTPGRTLTLEAERHCLCRALSWNHLCRRQVAARNARWRLRSGTCTLVVAGQITGLRTAGSEGRQKVSSIDRRASKAGAGTTSRFLGSDRKPCEPVATNCTRPPDPSLTSDKVNRSKCFLSAIFLSHLIIFSLFFCRAECFHKQK